MAAFAGYIMPIQYEGIVAEHEWTRSHASLFDVSHMGQLSVVGEKAATDLEKLLPCAIADLPVGEMRYSFLLNETGGIIDDLIVANAGPHYLLIVNGARKWDDIVHLHNHLHANVTLTHHEDQALLALQGPDAKDVLEKLIPATADLVFMMGAAFKWNEVELWVSRTGYTGEDGFELSVPEQHAAALAAALIADQRVKPAGLGARDSLRLEAGLPLYGHDLTTQTDPIAAGLGFALNRRRRKTGGYIGHEAIKRVLAKDSPACRVGLSVTGRLPAREGAIVYSGEDIVGEVTSGGFSPTLGRPIAMAYVNSAHAETGSALEIEVRGRHLPATVVPLPFVPHRYQR